MPNETKVASTTDSMEDVEAAAAVTPEELAAGRVPEPAKKNEEPVEEVVENRPRPSATGLQRRFDKLTRERYENLERIQQLEARLREIEAGSRSAETPAPEDKPAQPTKSEAEPQPEPQRLAEEQERLAHEVRQVRARFAHDYEAALPKGSPDRVALEQAAARTEAEVGGIHPGVAQIVMSMPNSIDVYAHLCTHPEDLRVLNASPSEAEALANVRYMSGVLRGMAQAQAAPKPKPAVRRPPEPIRPTRGASPTFSPSLEDADYQTFKRVREQQEKNYRRNR